MTDTRPGTLPNPAARWWSYPLAGLSALTLIAIVTLALLPASLAASKPVTGADGVTRDVATPYALVPASAEPVASRVSFGDLPDGVVADTEPEGRVFFVTISEPAQSLLGHWLSPGEPEIEPMTRIDKFGDQTPSQVRTIALQQMRTSSQTAQFVALQHAGYDAQRVPGPPQIGQFLCLEASGNTCTKYVPSEAKLQVGDIILTVDGEPVATSEELTAALSSKRPGDTVTLTVRRIDVDDVLTIEGVELISPQDGTDRAIIGYLPFDNDSVSLPFEIDIDTGEIGGPSAGLAFTLTLLDELTAGNLLGGNDVAVTGTIDIDGNVGKIGGLVQKASAVRQAGLHYFIVPAGQSDEELADARAVAGDGVEIIPVNTISEAIAVLESLGGDPPTPLPGRPDAAPPTSDAPADSTASVPTEAPAGPVGSAPAGG